MDVETSELVRSHKKIIEDQSTLINALLNRISMLEDRLNILEGSEMGGFSRVEQSVVLDPEESKKMRLEKLNELVEGETEYFNDIKMLKLFIEATQNVLSRADFRYLNEYMSIDTLLRVSENVLNCYVDAHQCLLDNPDGDVGAILSNIGPNITEYYTFCSRQMSATLMASYLGKDMGFLNFYNEREEFKTKSVSTWLTFPFRHLLEYPLQIQGFIMATHKSFDDYDKLNDEFDVITENLDSLVNIKAVTDARLKEENDKIRILQSQITNEETGQGIVLIRHNRQIISEVFAKIYKIKRTKALGSIKKLHVILFNDALLITTTKKNGSKILKSFAKLTDLSVLDYVDRQRNIIEDVMKIQTKTDSIDIQFETVDQKNFWDATINRQKRSVTASEALTETEMEEKMEKKALENRETRKRIILEIHETELSYLEDLEVITELFISPLKQNNILREIDIINIFGEIDIFAPLNRENIFNHLDKLIKTSNEKGIHLADIELGGIFQNLIPHLTKYQDYCSSQGLSLLYVGELLASNQEFSQFSANARQNPQARKQPLDSFLIKPVQRVCRYPLLIKQLLKYTPEEHPDNDLLTLALQQSEKSVDIINEMKRIYENRLADSLSATNSEHVDFTYPPEQNYSWIKPDSIIRKSDCETIERISNAKNKITLVLLLEALVFTTVRQASHHIDQFFYIDSVSILDADDIEKNSILLTNNRSAEGNSEILVHFQSDEEKTSWLIDMLSTKKLSSQGMSKKKKPSGKLQSNVTKNTSISKKFKKGKKKIGKLGDVFTKERKIKEEGSDDDTSTITTISEEPERSESLDSSGITDSGTPVPSPRNTKVPIPSPRNTGSPTPNSDVEKPKPPPKTRLVRSQSTAPKPNIEIPPPTEKKRNLVKSGRKRPPPVPPKGLASLNENNENLEE